MRYKFTTQNGSDQTVEAYGWNDALTELRKRYVSPSQVIGAASFDEKSLRWHDIPYLALMCLIIWHLSLLLIRKSLDGIVAKF